MYLAYKTRPTGVFPSVGSTCFRHCFRSYPTNSYTYQLKNLLYRSAPLTPDYPLLPRGPLPSSHLGSCQTHNVQYIRQQRASLKLPVQWFRVSEVSSPARLSASTSTPTEKTKPGS